MDTFRVGVTRDFLAPTGEIAMGDIGLQALKKIPGISVEFFSEFLPEVSRVNWLVMMQSFR